MGAGRTTLYTTLETKLLLNSMTLLVYDGLDPSCHIACFSKALLSQGYCLSHRYRGTIGQDRFRATIREFFHFQHSEQFSLEKILNGPAEGF